jgi:deoxycytidine triphosphate deaminase
VPFEDYADFATSQQEAARRFAIARRADPFPDIFPSLLNSADIEDYVRATGMLCPFDVSKLKSASYEARISGSCIYWDAAGRYNEVQLRADTDEFILPANSIAFVQIEPTLRLPDYIALRFNLKITHVHRGILLGTGPLVDPGFVGQLLIPLHNLTTNEYRLPFRDGLIWIEFTKTSTLPAAITEAPGGMLRRHGEYHAFDPKKMNIPAEEYLRRASPHRAIRSSIPDIGRDIQVAARRVQRLVKVITVAGLVGLVVAVLGILIPTWGLIQDATRSIQAVEQQLREVQSRQMDSLRKSEEQVQQLTTKVADLERRLQAAEKRERPAPTGAGAGR